MAYPTKPPISEFKKLGNKLWFKKGSKDFMKPININGKVSSLGIIKCFKSIKKIITKKTVKIKSKKVVVDRP